MAVNFTVDFNWVWEGRGVKNVLVFSGGSESEAFALAFGVAVEENAAILSLVDALGAQCSLTSLLVRFNNSTPGWSVEVPITPIPGGEGGQSLPLQNCILVSTVHAGVPPNRGRIYLPGLTEDLTAGAGVVGSATVTQIQTAMDDIVLNGIFVEGFGSCTLLIAHRTTAGYLAAANEVSAAIVRNKVRTQRRRSY